MANTKIKVTDHGPYRITGSFDIVDEEGNTFNEERTVSLCRCGYSDDKPYCDGTHEEIDFNSAPRAKDDVMIEV
ncbi:CDGSH iron-sulfur domain-containing protein [Virgibacillus sp. W0181]|uniref:CDGSH iron-sulfur domain-containing protein n=1 Tax=Virgibacillus sp. W0181 TaxID=3391581 RepID=UPI003F4511B6